MSDDFETPPEDDSPLPWRLIIPSILLALAVTAGIVYLYFLETGR
jgi:hypothetical protein